MIGQAKTFWSGRTYGTAGLPGFGVLPAPAPAQNFDPRLRRGAKEACLSLARFAVSVETPLPSRIR